MQGNAFGGRPAQRGEPVADLLEARIEACAEPGDVVTELRRGGEERRIGHGQRAGEIAGERPLQPCRGVGRGERGARDEFVEKRADIRGGRARRASRKREAPPRKRVGGAEAAGSPVEMLSAGRQVVGGAPLRP